MKEYSAGAITYTIINKKIHYLLIQDFHNNWGFPKGHLEENETLIETAIREVKEEVGVDVVIDSNFKDELIYKLDNGNEKHSIYFIGYYEDQTPIKQIEEVQDTKLLMFDNALDLLTFDNMKHTLIKANNYLLNL